MKNYPKISIIIPVYNAEKYLQRCIESVLCQSYSNFELLLIDDGSIDKSGRICDDYAVKDCRISVFHKKNGGVSSARNLGLYNAKGEWITFVDSDDVVYNNYLYALITNCSGENVFVMANYLTSHGILSKVKGGFYQGTEIIELIYKYNLLSLSAPYSKLYNTKILKENKILFDEKIHMGEDGLFLTEYLLYVDKLSFVPNIIYLVNDTDGSLSKCYNDFDSEYECFILWYNLIKKILIKYNVKGENAERIIWHGRIGETFVRLLKIIALSCEFKTKKERIQKYNYLCDSFYFNYFLYYTPPSFFNKVCNWLIKLKLYSSYIYLEKIKNLFIYGKLYCTYARK